MRHPNPTCQASTQPTGKARPKAAGSHRQAESKLEDKLAEREAFLVDFSPAERLQLSETARFDLDEEISMLKRTIKRFVRTAENAGEEDYPVNLAKSLDLLGLSCSRLASVLRVNSTLNGTGKDTESMELLKTLADFSQNLGQTNGASHE